MVDWGSVADWVAAIGTVAAFGGGVLVWASDIRQKRQMLPDLLAMSIVPGEGYVFTVSIHNLSELDFYEVMVGFNDVPGTANWLYGPNGGQITDRIMGKERLILTANEAIRPPENVFASFMDARGERWFVRRRGARFRYVSSRIYHRLAFARPTTRSARPLDYA